MYSCPSGCGSPGLLIRHGSSMTTVFPDPSQSAMLTGNTTGMNWPPVSIPVTAVASADAVNWLIPSARAKVVPKVWLPPTRTPWVPGGIVSSPSAGPTWAAAAVDPTATPAGDSRPPVTLV